MTKADDEKLKKIEEDKKNTVITNEIVNPRGDKSLLVIRIGDYFLGPAFKETNDAMASRVNDPTKAYNWQDQDLAINCALELSRTQCVGQFVAVQKINLPGDNMFMRPDILRRR